MTLKLLLPLSWAILFFSSLNQSLIAQISAQPAGKDFTHQLEFNPRFIAKNKIAEIKISIELKKDGDRIRNLFQSEIYRFNEAGMVESISKIDHKANDTSITYYSYRADQLRCEIKNDRAGLYSYCYEHENELPVLIEYSRSKELELLTASVSSEFKKDVSQERIEHKRYGDQLHSTYFNSADRPYSKEIRYYDENGYYIKFLKTFVMTSTFHKEIYVYNEKGYLSEVQVEKNNDAFKHSYEYDNYGQIIAENHFVNEELVYRSENVFHEDSMLLKAYLKRNEIDGNILIKTYSYQYKN